MNHSKTHLCALGGEERSPDLPRFLLAENTWEDKLTILQWDAQTASRAGIQVACSIDHVEELVIHWMTTVRLNYPFARSPWELQPGGALRRASRESASAADGKSVN